MSTQSFAKTFSALGVKARTRKRTILCVHCREPFTARSGKAKYCSRSCFNKASYLLKKDVIYGRLVNIHERIKDLIGYHREIDPKLIKISDLFDLIEIELKFHRR